MLFAKPPAEIPRAEDRTIRREPTGGFVALFIRSIEFPRESPCRPPSIKSEPTSIATRSSSTNREFVDDWIVELTDLTPRVRKMAEHLQSGRADAAKRLLPDERVYPLSAELRERLLMDD
jgi:hypothetical protein